MEEMTEKELESYKLHRRFDRMGRLIGDAGMEKLEKSHVMVIGIGGVGSWTAESLVRSGVGVLTLVDFDEVCITNFNRQLHAVQGAVGKKKAKVLAERLLSINPKADVRAIPLFYNSQHASQIFAQRPDYVVDGIDNLTAKCHLLDYCLRNQIPVVSSMGSGGRMDPTQIRVADLALTEKDPMARAVRRILRETYHFSREEGRPFGIPSVYSIEPPIEPKELVYDGGKGFRCVCQNGENPYFNCDNRHLIWGNTSFVTGTFGLVCASVVVRSLTEA